MNGVAEINVKQSLTSGSLQFSGSNWQVSADRVHGPRGARGVGDLTQKNGKRKEGYLGEKEGEPELGSEG